MKGRTTSVKVVKKSMELAMEYQRSTTTHEHI